MSKTTTEITKAPKPDPLRQVVGWIVSGHSEADITEAIGKTWPGAKPKPLIIEALKSISSNGAPDGALIRGFAIEGTREIYRKCLEVADHQTALRALKQLVELARK